MSIAHVSGAVLLAKRFGVTDADITSLLTAAGLRWNDAREVVTVKPL